MIALVPPTIWLPEHTEALRSEVRVFLDAEIAAGRFTPRIDAWLSAWDADFSKRLGERGWLGMTVPTEYGGHGLSSLERYVVTEELLAAGAPVSAHWIADRQIAPSLMRFGTEEQRETYLPKIARGECYFAIGLSEPDAGSDLAAVRSSAVKVDGGWQLNGRKVWTSGAHLAHAFFALARTAPVEGRDRHKGLTQFLVHLDWPGVTIRPIRLISGAHHFNEVIFDDVFVPDARVLGEPGDGWHTATAELAFERSGPERILSTFALLTTLVDALSDVTEDRRAAVDYELGPLVSRMWTLRQMSLAVAGALARGELPDVAASLVKDLGTQLEIAVIDSARLLSQVQADPSADANGPHRLARLLADSVLQAPGFSLRGGTSEILRGMVARGLGLR